MQWNIVAANLSSDALRFLLALHDLSTNNEIPLTVEGVCDAYGIPRIQASSVVKELVDKGYVKKNKDSIRLVSESRSIKFVPSSPERYEELEQENVELKSLMKARVLGETSGLADKLFGDERLFIQDVERLLGRGMSVNESFLLGKCLQGWGLERTRALLLQKLDAENPFVIVYAMLKNGARGRAFKPAQGEKERTPTYRERT